MAPQAFEHNDGGLNASSAAGRQWQQSIPSRMAAIGFIILIVMGNFWLIDALLGVPVQGWMRFGLQIGTTSVFLGATGLLVRAIISIFR